MISRSVTFFCSIPIRLFLFLRRRFMSSPSLDDQAVIFDAPCIPTLIIISFSLLPLVRSIVVTPHPHSLPPFSYFLSNRRGLFESNLGASHLLLDI